METRRNFQQQQIGGKRTQTMIFDPKQTDELNPDFQEAAREMIQPGAGRKKRAQDPQNAEQSAKDYGLNHDYLDELSQNIAESKILK